MKKVLIFLMCIILGVSAFVGITVSAEAERNKGVRIKFTPTSSSIIIPSSSQDLWAAVDKGNEAVITVYNNGTEAYSLFARAVNASWSVTVDSVKATVQPNSAAEIHCSVKGDISKIVLMAVDKTKAGDITVLNLTGDEADGIRNTFSASAHITDIQVVDNVSVTPTVYEIFPQNLPAVEGGSLITSARRHRCAGPRQELVDVLNKNGSGTYYFSGNFRLIDDESFASAKTRGVNVLLGIYVKTDTGYSKYHMGSASIVKDGSWTLSSQTAELAWTGTVTEAYMFIQTVYADKPSSADSDDYYYPGAIEWDAFSLNKASTQNGVKFGENLMTNPTCEPDRVSVAAGWTLNIGGSYGQMVNSQKYVSDYTATENSDGTVTYKKGCVPLTDKNIYYSGRWIDVDDETKRASFESYVELKFTGTSVYASAPFQTGVYLQLDGGDIRNVYLYAGITKLATGLGAGTHTVRIYATQQTARPAISGFFIDEGASTVPLSITKKIEFIGDSILEGYVCPDDKAEGISNNSVLNSYGYKTGVMLGEKYGMGFNIVAFGGIGITKRDSVGGNYDHLTMPERYFKEREYIKGTDTSAEITNAIKAWDTTKYVPDYAVINLGTNDGHIESNAFKNDYTSFINKLLNTYDNTVFFVMTPFNGAKRTEIKEVVNAVNSDRVVLIDSAEWSIPGGKDNVHPSAASHDTAAQKLFTVLSAYIDANDNTLGNQTTPTPTPVLMPTPAPEKAPVKDTGSASLSMILTALPACIAAVAAVIKKRRSN